MSIGVVGLVYFWFRWVLVIHWSFGLVHCFWQIWFWCESDELLLPFGGGKESISGPPAGTAHKFFRFFHQMDHLVKSSYLSVDLRI